MRPKTRAPAAWPRALWAGALGVALVAPQVAAAGPPSGPPPPIVHPTRPDAEQGAKRFRTCRLRWSCCRPGEPCVRPRPARALLLSLGVVAGGVASLALFALGDRNGGGDPSVLLVGAGGVAGVGALTGIVAGWLGADRPADPDRVRPATVGLTYGIAEPGNLDEREPHSMTFDFAPTFRFPSGWGRMRLVGHVGGWLWPREQVDPRPQNNTPIDGQSGTAPVVLEQRQFSFGMALDTAVALPYPVLPPKHSAFLGPSEIRWKPEVQIRRERVDHGDRDSVIVERTMFLPLTVGMRWHLSGRQRFTFYVGPRFDFVSFSNPGETDLRRGRAVLGPLHGEAWYDLDVPFTRRPRRDGKLRRATVNGQLSVGYVHSRFTGHGLNFGPVVGFLGPVHVQWHTRVRPRGSIAAFQATVSARIGGGVGGAISVGATLPDIKRRKR